MPSHHKKIVGTPASILLVEEYQPLAMAFGSAVQKFAGNYETHVVLSLGEAEKSLRVSRPELIVLDFDPPPTGSVEFFQRLKASMPETRVLILVAEKVPELSGLLSSPQAFHFIEKPFDLADFGAALGQLLGSKDDSGKMRDFSLVDLITLYALSGASLILRVEAAPGRAGEIHFAEGRIQHASAAAASGIEAFQAIVRWRSPSFIEAERHADSPRSMQTSWATLLADALRAAEAKPESVPAEIAPASPSAKAGKKIVIVDDTELLSLFVGESLTASDPTLEISASLTGLDGLNRITENKPDLVLLDFSLPDVTGDEVARRLLENPETADIPIIMMSGHVREMALAAEHLENIVATIAKPFLSNALVDLVRQTLTTLPKRSEPRAKKPVHKGAASVRAETHVIEAKKARNGRRAGSKHPPIASKAVEIPNPQPESDPEPESIREPVEKLEEDLSQESTSVASPVTEEEEIAFDPISLSSPPEAEFAELNPIASPATAQGSEIPAAIKTAKSNSVVLGFPLEVISLEFSTELRIEKVRARPFSSVVSMRVLPHTVSGTSISETSFELAEVTLDENAQIDVVRLAPARDLLPKFSRYPSAIDGVRIAPAKGGQAIELTPTEVAPMRLQLLALFELSSVELSPEFRVAHLVLKSRGQKTRATLLPEVAQTGATFEIAQVRIDRLSAIGEIILQAAPA